LEDEAGRAFLVPLMTGAAGFNSPTAESRAHASMAHIFGDLIHTTAIAPLVKSSEAQLKAKKISLSTACQLLVSHMSVTCQSHVSHLSVACQSLILNLHFHTNSNQLSKSAKKV
jgi:hypothetical protein